MMCRCHKASATKSYLTPSRDSCRCFRGVPFRQSARIPYHVPTRALSWATVDIPSNIFLIGPMGAGKSTIGRRLAAALGKDFVDADQALEERTGVEIPLIFELEGEEGFRKREREMLARLVVRDGIVLATGGGVVLSAENRSHLAQRGFVVYLDAPIDLLVSRVARDRHRPLMQTDDPKATMRELMRVRDPLYRECADIVVRSTHRSARFVVREILQCIETL